MNKTLEYVKTLQGILKDEIEDQEALLCLGSDNKTIVDCAKDILKNKDNKPWIRERWKSPLRLVEYFNTDIVKDIKDVIK